MKKPTTLAILILVAIVIIVLATSCEKEKSADFACTLYIVSKLDSVTIDSVAYPNTYYDRTHAEMNAIINVETYTGYRNSNGIYFTVDRYMQCGEIVCPN